MKTIIVLALVALLLIGCNVGREAPSTMTSETNFTFLALGDSYTIGQSVADAERWPVQLAAALRAQGIPVGEPTIIARTGWTTAELLAAIQSRPDGEEYDLVSILIGVNDQYRGYPLAEYQETFKALLHMAIIAARGQSDRVVVLSVPDWAHTPFGESSNRAAISAEIDSFNTVNRTESLAAGVHYVDITGTSRPPIVNTSLLAADGLHPNGAMYALWVEMLMPQMVELFGE